MNYFLIIDTIKNHLFKGCFERNDDCCIRMFLGKRIPLEEELGKEIFACGNNWMLEPLRFREYSPEQTKIFLRYIPRNLDLEIYERRVKREEIIIHAAVLDVGGTVDAEMAINEDEPF